MAPLEDRGVHPQSLEAPGIFSSVLHLIQHLTGPQEATLGLLDSAWKKLSSLLSGQGDVPGLLILESQCASGMVWVYVTGKASKMSIDACDLAAPAWTNPLWAQI